MSVGWCGEGLLRLKGKGTDSGNWVNADQISEDEDDFEAQHAALKS